MTFYRRSRQIEWDALILVLGAAALILASLAGRVMKPVAGLILLGVLGSGCMMKTRRVFHSEEIAFYQQNLHDQQLEIDRLKEEELFEEGMTENIQRDYDKLQAKVKKYLALNCLCKHKDVLR